jgi:hypothetical protein
MVLLVDSESGGVRHLGVFRDFHPEDSRLRDYGLFTQRKYMQGLSILEGI